MNFLKMKETITKVRKESIRPIKSVSEELFLNKKVYK